MCFFLSYYISCATCDSVHLGTPLFAQTIHRFHLEKENTQHLVQWGYVYYWTIGTNSLGALELKHPLKKKIGGAQYPQGRIHLFWAPAPGLWLLPEALPLLRPEALPPFCLKASSVQGLTCCWNRWEGERGAPTGKNKSQHLCIEQSTLVYKSKEEKDKIYPFWEYGCTTG